MLLESTKCQAHVIPAVAQATSGSSVATLLHADSAMNATSEDILNLAQPHQLAYFTTVPTAFDRPPAAPDPVTGGTLLKPGTTCDCTPHSEM